MFLLKGTFCDLCASEEFLTTNPSCTKTTPTLGHCTVTEETLNMASRLKRTCCYSDERERAANNPQEGRRDSK